VRAAHLLIAFLPVAVAVLSSSVHGEGSPLPNGQAQTPAPAANAGTEAGHPLSVGEPPKKAPAAEASAPERAAAEGKPAEVKAEKAGEKPAVPEISAPKPAEAKETNAPPAKPAEQRKPAESKDAAAGAKPKELTPKVEGAEEFSQRASTVNAVYRIQWLGAHIGDFKIRSAITNRRYNLQATADVSVFFGAVSWHGATNSYGMMSANGPVPQNYSFKYATNDKREAIEVRFQQRMVQDIIINPPARPGAHAVPITAAHLQNVVDPLSAVVLLSQMRLSRQGGEVCDKRIPIFDGRIRYDLVLSPKGTRAISGSGKLRGVAHVCKIHYVPIAGHKAGKQGGDYATGNTGIEVWLVPVPEAGLLIPYYVHVPTPAGTASLVTAKFDLETPGGRHALAE
jgi:Protein of unknown function (DUF3108)